MFGYYGALIGLRYKNERSVMRALELGRYTDFETITLRVPMSLPYMPDQSEFERLTGKFEYRGELYRLVKQQYAKDTLTVVCIKDEGHKKIDGKLSDYAKGIADVVITNHSNEYLPLTISIDSSSTGWILTLGHDLIQETLLPTFSASINHPPEVA